MVSYGRWSREVRIFSCRFLILPKFGIIIFLVNLIITPHSVTKDNCLCIHYFQNRFAFYFPHSLCVLHENGLLRWDQGKRIKHNACFDFKIFYNSHQLATDPTSLVSWKNRKSQNTHLDQSHYRAFITPLYNQIFMFDYLVIAKGRRSNLAEIEFSIWAAHFLKVESYFVLEWLKSNLYRLLQTWTLLNRTTTSM